MPVRINPAPVVDLIEAFRRSKAMFTAVSLGLFDNLAGKPKSASKLAEELKLGSDALTRLLDTCVALKLAEKGKAGYRNLPVADVYLRRGSPDTLAGYILYSNRALYALWGHLEDAVREGSDRWQQTFGMPGPLFGHFFRLLEKIYIRLPKGGALLVAERLLDDSKTGPLSALLQSLNMLVCTEGKERTLAEYAALLRDSGFSKAEGRKTGAPLDAILAVKG